MKIGRTYRFEAAHFLPNVPPGHKCRGMHGHNYRIEVVVDGDVDRRGFVLDFAELDALVLPLIAKLDHRVLNDVIPNPTAEIIAAWFMKELHGGLLARLDRVRVWETDDCWAEVS